MCESLLHFENLKTLSFCRLILYQKRLDLKSNRSQKLLKFTFSCVYPTAYEEVTASVVLPRLNIRKNIRVLLPQNSLS